MINGILDFWKNNEEKIGNIQEMCNAMWRELKAKAQAHNNECWEELEPHEKDVFKKPWIYVRKVSVFDLIDGCDIKGAGYSSMWNFIRFESPMSCGIGITANRRFAR